MTETLDVIPQLNALSERQASMESSPIGSNLAGFGHLEFRINPANRFGASAVAPPNLPATRSSGRRHATIVCARTHTRTSHGTVMVPWLARLKNDQLMLADLVCRIHTIQLGEFECQGVCQEVPLRDPAARGLYSQFALVRSG